MPFIHWLDGVITRVWRALFRQGNLRLWAIIAGAPFLCAGAVGLVWMIRYGWPADRAEQQLTILGYALFGNIALIGIIVIALATVKVRATLPSGAGIAVGGADDPVPDAGPIRDEDSDGGWPRWPSRRAPEEYRRSGRLSPDERIGR